MAAAILNSKCLAPFNFDFCRITGKTLDVERFLEYVHDFFYVSGDDGAEEQVSRGSFEPIDGGVYVIFVSLEEKYQQLLQGINQRWKKGEAFQLHAFRCDYDVQFNSFLYYFMTLSQPKDLNPDGSGINPN